MRLAPLALLLVAAAGCDAGPDRPGVMYMPDMVVSTPYDAHDRNPILPNGLTLQPPPEGTVPRGYAPYHYGPDEAELAAEVANPIAPDEAALARGRAQYETFCAVCHGPRAEGDGTVVPPFPNPPSLRAERFTSMPDGRIFHVITHGKGLMPAYAAQVRADDRWRIVHHLRTLQGLEPGSVPAAEPSAPSDAPAAADASVEPADALDGPEADVPAVEAPAADPPAADPRAAEPPTTVDAPATDGSPSPSVEPANAREAPRAPDAPEGESDVR